MRENCPFGFFAFTFYFFSSSFACLVWFVNCGFALGQIYSEVSRGGLDGGKRGVWSSAATVCMFVPHVYVDVALCMLCVVRACVWRVGR